MVEAIKVTVDTTPPPPVLITVGPQGVEGIQGVKGLQWQGDWSAVVDYVVDDVVAHGDDLHIAVAPSTDSEPPSADWQTFVDGSFPREWTDFIEIPEPDDPAAGHLRLFAGTERGYGVLEYKNGAGRLFRIGQDNFRIIRNTSGATFERGQMVFYSGSTGSAPNAGLARADNTDTMPAVAMVAVPFDNNAFGIVIVMGLVDGLDTSAFAEGDQLFVSSTVAGALTNIRPSHPDFAQAIGTVERSHANQGVVLVNVTPFKGGHESGTNRNEFAIGDGLAGAKDLAFVNAFRSLLRWNPTEGRILLLPDVTGALLATNPAAALEDRHALVWDAASGLWLPSQVAFKELGDTPESYVGHAGKAVVVNPDEDGLDYKEFPVPITSDTNFKDNVRLASTGPIDLATGGLLVVDDVQTVAGDRVLVKNQGDILENGIYDVVDGGAWIRSADALTPEDLEGLVVYVEEGTVNGESLFAFSSSGGDTIIEETTASGGNLITRDVKSDAYTLKANDLGHWLVMLGHPSSSGDPMSVTVPNANSAGGKWPTHSELVIQRRGTGPLTIIAASGVTIHSPHGLVFPFRDATLRLKILRKNEWVVEAPLMPLFSEVVTETADFTFGLQHAGRWTVVDSPTPVNATVPPQATVAWPDWVEIHVRQKGLGQVTIVEGTDVVVETPETLKLAKQGATATLKQEDTDDWAIAGYLELA